MSDFISNYEAKIQTINNIRNFCDHINTPYNIMSHIIRNGQSSSMKMVICLHIIIMFKDNDSLSEYLENIYDLHGAIVCEFIVNYAIQHSPIFVSNQEPIVSNQEPIVSSNSINALTCAALWNTDIRVIDILIHYGADINSTNESGLFANEISEQFPYYNHLISFIHITDTSVNVVGKRLFNDFADVYHLLCQIAGEA
jgi:hypothetical protein